MRKALLALALLALASLPLPAAEPERIGSWTVLPFGAANPVINCAPLAACIVVLEEGEVVQSRFLPDSARWQVEPGTTGPGAATPVLGIKPKECGIATNFLLTTDRRVYTFILNAPPCDPLAITAASLSGDQIRFTYPEEFARLWQAPPAPPLPPLHTTAASRFQDLNFHYSWSTGRRAIKPRTVYDDGSRTYIVLTDRDRLRDAPAVFVRGEKDLLEAVNFSPPMNGGSTYTVDRVAEELVLVSGPDKTQKTIISREKER